MTQPNQRRESVDGSPPEPTSFRARQALGLLPTWSYWNDRRVRSAVGWKLGMLAGLGVITIGPAAAQLLESPASLAAAGFGGALVPILALGILERLRRSRAR